MFCVYLYAFYNLVFTNVYCINKETENKHDAKLDGKSNLRNLDIFRFYNDFKKNDVVHVHEDYQIGSGTRRMTKFFNVNGKKIIGDYPFTTFNITYKNSNSLEVFKKCDNFEIHHIHFRILADPLITVKHSLIESLTNSVLNDVSIEIPNDLIIEETTGILASHIYNTTLINVRIIFNNLIIRISSQEGEGISTGVIIGQVQLSNNNNKLQYIDGVSLKGNSLKIESYIEKEDENNKSKKYSIFGLLFGDITSSIIKYKEIEFDDNNLYITNSFIDISEFVVNVTNRESNHYIIGGLIGSINHKQNNVYMNKCFIKSKVKIIQPVSIFGYIVASIVSDLIINNTWAEIDFSYLKMKKPEYIGIVGFIDVLMKLYIDNSYYIISLPNNYNSIPTGMGYITGKMDDNNYLYINNNYMYIKSNNKNNITINAFGDAVGNIKNLSIKKNYVISNNSNTIIHKYKNIINPSNYEEFVKDNSLSNFEYSKSDKLLIHKNMIFDNNNDVFLLNKNVIIFSNLNIIDNKINYIDCESNLLLQSMINFKSTNETIILKIKQFPSKILNISDSIIVTNEWYALYLKLYEVEINKNNDVNFTVSIVSGINIININMLLSCSTNHKPITRNTIVKETVKTTENATVTPTESNDPIPKYSGLKQFIIFICGIMLLVIVLYYLYRKANTDEENDYVPVVQDPEEAEHFLDPSN